MLSVIKACRTDFLAALIKSSQNITIYWAIYVAFLYLNIMASIIIRANNYYSKFYKTHFHAS